MQAVQEGLSADGGEKCPGSLKLGSERNIELVSGLLNHKGMCRIVGFVKRKWPCRLELSRNLSVSSGSMEAFAPKLCGFVTETFKSIKDSDPSISFPYDDHPFSALTFNIGPRACTKPHKDVMNLSWGWCAVTSMGSYDHTKGGHLILWELGLAVEFPPYSTIFLPSAVLTHGNTVVGVTE